MALGVVRPRAGGAGVTVTMVWLLAVTGPLLFSAALGTFGGVPVDRLRAVAVACGALAVTAASLVFVVPGLAALRINWPGMAHPLLGASLLRVTEFTAPLVALPAGLWLMTVTVTPRGRLDRSGLQRTAVATCATTVAFLTESPILLGALWVVSTLLFLKGLSPSERTRTRRVAGLYAWVSTALLWGGILLTTLATEPAPRTAGLWLIVAAVLIRKGIVPFHAWIPEAFDRGRIGPVLLFSAPQLGTYVAAVLVLPYAADMMLRTVGVLSLVTTLYGAALALAQRDARRACGYLFVSQSALVLAGLAGQTPESVAGSLVLWISSALAFTGMGRTVLAIEARRGRLDLNTYHGGYEQMPLLAASFLVLGLACTGFPGTLGFVGEEMLLEGAVHAFPVLGFLVLAASSLTGLLVLRMYFALFCGSSGGAIRLPLLRREALMFGAVATCLVVAGVFPRPFVASRLRAAESALLQRVEPRARHPSRRPSAPMHAPSGLHAYEDATRGEAAGGGDRRGEKKRPRREVPRVGEGTAARTDGASFWAGVGGNNVLPALDCDTVLRVGQVLLEIAHRHQCGAACGSGCGTIRS